MQFLKKLNKFEEYLGGTLFLILFALLILQIVMPLLGSPLAWSDELARFIFVYVGLLGVSQGIKTQQHVLVDFVCDKLPSTPKKVVFSGVQVIIFTCLLLFIYFGVKLFIKAKFPLQSLGISEKWLYLALPTISVLMLIRFFQVQQQNVKAGLSLIPAWVFVGVTVVATALFFYDPNIYKVLRLSKYFHLGDHAVYVALLVWLVIMFLGTPVGWSLFIASIVYFSLTRWKLSVFDAFSLVDSTNNFILLAVPFFVLTGILMNSSGITERIFNFAKAMLGHHVGGMGHVNISASLIFSGMSGSALADAGGLGQLEIKAMRDAGYDDDLCGGITAASCIIGPLVPPSIAMIIYGVIANQSIAKLFLAGFVPGVMLTITLMMMNAYLCKKRAYPLAPKASSAERKVAFKKAFLPLLTPIIIIGGIFSGIFTPTESAVVAALYSVVLGFYYGELNLKKLFDNAVEAMAVSGVIVLMVMTVTYFGKMIAREQVAMQVAEGFMSVATTTVMVLIMINLLLLFLGMFIDALALQFLVLPMLIPIAQQFDIDLIFFGVMTTLNMMIGILTPPMGMALFVVARVGNMTVSTVTKGVIPFIIPIFLTLVLITIFPEVVTFIPNLVMGK
ncbi:MAG: C4-dicarboxylate ABC transporter permease [Gammaproteobacteria bacterium]|nr:MAG: C4-dicarboxylate ABC transporter permease [Gammaproteobacteria bacterium]